MEEAINVKYLNKICLGIQGENKAKTVRIDISDWLKEFPDGRIAINVFRPTEKTYYSPEITISNGILSWLVTNADNAIVGMGKGELRLRQGSVLKKSIAFTTCIEPSLELGDGPVPPTPSPSWVEELIEQVEENTEDIAEIQSAYLKDAVVEDSTLIITKQDDSTISFEGGKSGYYEQLKKLEDYGYEASYIDLNYEYAKKRFAENEPTMEIGGCSSLRNGDYFGRNLDETYDNKVSFAVHTPHIGGRYATTAVCGQIGGLTKSFVESGAYSDDYVLLPFVALDGRNEYGVFASVNFVPTDKGENAHAYPSESVEEKLSANMLVRYIIDNFDTAEKAVDYISRHCEIYTSAQFISQGFNSHWLVGDKTSTYLIELIENSIVVADISDRPYITNFHNYEVTYNDDGTVYTPSTQDATHNAVDTNNIEIHGQGLERYNIIVDNYNTSATQSGMRSLLSLLKYTNAYQPNQNWFTEFTGGSLHVNSEPSAFSGIVAQAQQEYRTRSRNNPVTWQTVHSSVYNIKTGELYVVFQEGDTEHLIPFDTIEGGKIDVIALGNTDLPIVDKKVTIPFAVPNGVASLGTDGKVPSEQLPSYVDDIVERPTRADFPAVGESGKLYIAQDTNKAYRWGTTTYVQINPQDTAPTLNSQNYVTSGGVYAVIEAEKQARIDADDAIDSNITTLAQGLSEAQQNIQELDTDLSIESERAEQAEEELLDDIDATNDRLDTEIQARQTADTNLQQQIDDIEVPVTSVNNKTGDVVLDATDILLTTNRQTVENNFIRVDEEINRVDEDVQAKVDKLVPPSDTTIVYSATVDGQGSTVLSNNPSQGFIPVYDDNGNIKSSTPVDSEDVINKGYGDSRYAPITYVANLYGSIYLGGQTVRLIDNKPTAGQYNFLSSISTNTEYNWNSPTITFDRIIENPIDLTNTNSLTFSLKYIARRNATISWGAKVQCSSDGQVWQDISTQQSFNAVTVQANAGTTTDITVFTDGIVGVKRLETGDYLRILLYKKQESTTSLTTDIYFGVMVDNAYVCTYAQFNFLSVTIDTAQIKDGSVTYQKLSDNLQQTINGKLDKNTSVTTTDKVYGVTANGTQQMVEIDGNGDDTLLTRETIADTYATQTALTQGLAEKQDTITLANKLSSDLVDDTNQTNKFVTASEKTTWNNKQPAGDYATRTELSNGLSGKLDKVTISDGNVRVYTIEADGSQNYRRATSSSTRNAIVARDNDGRAKFGSPVDDADASTKGYVDTGLASKQDTLVSGTNIKTINNQSLLGSGDVSIPVVNVDQIYSATSTNAQSGTAVAQALLTVPKGVTELPNQYNRITDLDAGVYKLTYNGTKYLYYNGSTSTTTHTVTGGAGSVILVVSKNSTTYWHWYYINGSTSYATLYYGYTSTSSGSTGSKAINSLLTSVTIPSTYKQVPSSTYANYSLGYYSSTGTYGTPDYTLNTTNFLYPGQYAISLGTSSSTTRGAPYTPAETVRALLISNAPYYTSNATYRPYVEQEIIIYENKSERRFKRLWSASTGFGKWTEIPQFEGTDFDWEV